MSITGIVFTLLLSNTDVDTGFPGSLGGPRADPLVMLPTGLITSPALAYGCAKAAGGSAFPLVWMYNDHSGAPSSL